MSLKKYNPTSAARRQGESIRWRELITRIEPERSLTGGRARAFGRNAYGRITTRHKGAGAKRLWRAVDFLYDKKDIPARVISIEYDPNRSSLIALVHFRDGERRYVLAPSGLRVGQEVVTSEIAPLEVGNRTLLRRIPIGATVYNVELSRGRGAVMVRSAGSGAVVLAQEEKFTNLQLPSKEVRRVHSDLWASVGSLSNPEHKFMTIGKAGRARHMGIRPTVRGTAMNPVDHPHGGGEGRTQIGRRRGPMTPWGKPARGVKTRKSKKASNAFILEGRKK